MEKLNSNSEIFTRAVADIITRDGLEKLLGSTRQMRIKYGVDVTASNLHVGHAVNLWKMRALQEYGHKVVFLIGDFTTRIGDPTGRSETRKKLSNTDIDAWANGFLEQAGQVVLTDKKLFEVRKNSEWYDRMHAQELLGVMSLFTHARLIERDMFQKRMKEGREIVMPELIYPILQGYDSVTIESDMTIIGTDQLFNENVGRVLQEKFGQAPQIIVTTVITPGLDGGAKMSKSLGNYIGLSDTPENKFGKAMRLRDDLIGQYLEVYTDAPLEQIATISEELKRGSNPMDAKLFFAEALVRRYHGEDEAKKARDSFISVFSNKELPKDIQEFHIQASALDIPEMLVQIGFGKSKSDARRLVEQGGVEIDGERVRDPTKKIEKKDGILIRVGRRKTGRVFFDQ